MDFWCSRKCPSDQVSKCPSVQVSKCQSVQVSKCPRVQVSKCSGLTHLEREDSKLIIDGAAGNPAWEHPGLDSLKAHPRWKKPLDYFWCNTGALLEEKPFRRRSHVMTTIKLPTIKSWNTCCGETIGRTHYSSDLTIMEGI